jgi:hypothetical protein
VSNQYIRDKERSTAEDDLRKLHAIDVRIFDLTWILDHVFNQRLDQLAIDTLGLTLTVRHEVKKGPRDIERESDLERLEERIADAVVNQRHTPGLVNDALHAAELARGLERPRTEVDGVFARAERMAQQFGTRHQQIRSAYDQAWTAFWWYEDYYSYLRFYDQVEERAHDSTNAYELELWTNLFNIMPTAIGHLDEASNGKLENHANRLLAELNRLSLESTRPSSALQAK